jgi:pentatricopeptide repeat protein
VNPSDEETAVEQMWAAAAIARQMCRDGRTAEAETLLDQMERQSSLPVSYFFRYRLSVYEPGSPESEALLERLWNDGEFGTTAVAQFAMFLAVDPMYVHYRHFARPLADRVLTQDQDAIALDYAARAYYCLCDSEAMGRAFDACAAAAQNDPRTRDFADYAKGVRKEKAKLIRTLRAR